MCSLNPERPGDLKEAYNITGIEDETQVLEFKYVKTPSKLPCDHARLTD